MDAEPRDDQRLELADNGMAASDDALRIADLRPGKREGLLPTQPGHWQSTSIAPEADLRALALPTDLPLM